MSASWTVALDEPAEHDGKRVAELRLRPPTAGEMLRALEKLDAVSSPASRAEFELALVREVVGPSLTVELAEQIDRYVVLSASAWLASHEPPVGPGDERDKDGIVRPSGAPRPRSWVLPLDEIASYGGNTCAELALRPPRQGEMQKALSAAGAQPTIRTMLLSQIVLVSLVTGQPRGVIERIPNHAVAGAAGWLQGFTLRSPATTPSAPPG